MKYCLTFLVLPAITLAIQPNSIALAEERSLEERWRLAADLYAAADYEASLPLLVGIRKDLASFEAEPAQLAGLDFDIGNCLLELHRFAEAREAFRRCFLTTASEAHKREVLTAIGDKY